MVSETSPSEITYMVGSDVRRLIWQLRGERRMWGELIIPHGEAGRIGIVFHRYVQRGGTYDGWTMVFYGWPEAPRRPVKYRGPWDVRVTVDEGNGEWDVLYRADATRPWRLLTMDHAPLWIAEEKP